MEHLLHPDDRTESSATTRRFAGARDGEVLEIEYRMRHASGRWVLLRSRDLLFSRRPDGTPRQIIGTAEDITERRQAQQALRESEERFRRLAENAQDFIYRYRLWPVAAWEYASPAATLVTGYSPEEFYADLTLPEKIIHPDDIGEVIGKMGTGELFEQPLLTRWKHKNGSWIITEGRNTAIYDADGRLVAVEGIARDITERKRAEDALRDSEERFRRLAGNVQDIIFRVRTQPTFEAEYISPAITALLGYTIEECLNGTVGIEKCVHPDDHLQSEEYLAGKIPFDRPLIIRMLRKDKVPVLMEICSSPIHDAAGRLVAIEGIARDITERQRAEEALRERASLRELSHRIIQSQEEERRRLSRELHDRSGPSTYRHQDQHRAAGQAYAR